MVIGTALGWHDLPTVVLSIVLAFVFGYALTMRPLLRARAAARRARSRSPSPPTRVSIATMEIVDNAIVLPIPGAMDAGLATRCSGAACVLAGRRRSSWPSRSTGG